MGAANDSDCASQARRSAGTCAPTCQYYAATFEAMVHPTVRVRELACGAARAPACTFAITW